MNNFRTWDETDTSKGISAFRIGFLHISSEIDIFRPFQIYSFHFDAIDSITVVAYRSVEDIERISLFIFQTCMLVDIFCGTNILSEWAVVWLGLPILAHSGANPWVYAFHHGEMRVAAGKIAEDLVALFGVMPSRYGCSPTRRGSNTNLELAEVNNDSNESRRHPSVEDCFTAAKQHNVLYASRRSALEMSGRQTDISLEKHDRIEHAASCSSRPGDIIEESIHDLTKMLDPKYIIDRNHVIDSNHNIDKIKNLKYLLDPTFNKIRHLRRLNHKRLNDKSFPLISEPKFISYQNLKSDGAHGSRKFFPLNALSDPMLNGSNTSVVDTKDFNEALCHNNVPQKRNSNLSSMSDSNLKAVTTDASRRGTRLFPANGNGTENRGCSVQNLDHGYEAALARHAMMLSQQLEDQRRSTSKAISQPRSKFRHFGRASPNLKLRLRNYSSASSSNSVRPDSNASTPRRSISPSIPHVTITSNKLANLINLDPPRNAYTHRINLTARTVTQTRKTLDVLKHSESINTIDPYSTHRVTLLEPSNLMDSLIVPTIHSEPPSPIDPFPSASLQDEEAQSLEFPGPSANDNVAQRAKSPLGKKCSPVRHSDPVIPTVLLNIEDYSEPSIRSDNQTTSQENDLLSSNTPTLEPIDLFEALLRNSDKGKDARLPEPIFAEHDSTRFSSRRPSDSKWSESSRSQEILPSVTEHQTFPSSYSVNNFQTCNSGSDLNDLTSLDPFMCPDALSSSLRESFFSAPSVPDSDIFTSFEESDGPIFTPDFTPDFERDTSSAYNSMSTVNLKRCVIEATFQSRSTESVHRVRYPSTRSCAILKLEPAVHSNRLRVKPCTNYILRDPPRFKRNPRLAPLAIPTPTDICTPTFDIVSEIKSDNGVGVRV